MRDGDQATASVLRVSLSPTGEAQKRALFEIITPVGMGQPYPLCLPCVAMIGQTFCLCNQHNFSFCHFTIHIDQFCGHEGGGRMFLQNIRTNRQKDKKRLTSVKTKFSE
jgi:hypothetical protein